MGTGKVVGAGVVDGEGGMCVTGLLMVYCGGEGDVDGMGVRLRGC